MLHITADANIPFAQQAFGALGTVRTLPGREITNGALAETDVLLVRSVTRVDAALLDGTPVRWVGTATAGTDHVDADALGQRGIAFASAPGSNAASVADWVLAALLAVAADRGEALAGRTLGIVGAGAVGGRLAARAVSLGLAVLACDPPRQSQGEGGLVGLSEVLAQSDVVTLHAPLTGPADGDWPTWGMIDSRAVRAMRPDAWLVNAARGGIVTADAALALARSPSRPLRRLAERARPTARTGPGRRHRHAPRRRLRLGREGPRHPDAGRRAPPVGEGRGAGGARLAAGVGNAGAHRSARTNAQRRELTQGVPSPCGRGTG